MHCGHAESKSTLTIKARGIHDFLFLLKLVLVLIIFRQIW